ncbi:hypothetical protein H257_19117 [Aphanomyces astaci]|nr:hypothetical protein H257_19117 [Aphanomyces astaci]ETV63950.1 hypothetical protein H257_19117 [Aphanomyces astaci]|eukprot:XP_009846566.1 hypothetical protein H257_19117 [Aphanomyces astaci]
MTSSSADQGPVRRFLDGDDTGPKDMRLQSTEVVTLHVVDVPADTDDDDHSKQSAKLPHGDKPPPLLWCDGIRGVASQIVVTFHLLFWFKFLEQYADTTWYHTLRAGNAAVEMFLILSGFVLTVRFFARLQVIERAVANGDATTVRLVYVDAYLSMASTGVRRIPRLMGPVVISTVLHIFISLYRGHAIAPLALVEDVLKTLFVTFPPFNLTLWTLRVELEGSLFTMAVCVMLSKLRYRHRVVACLVALPIFHNRFGNWTGSQSHYFGCFVLGILVSDIINKQQHQLAHGPLPSSVSRHEATVFPRTPPNTVAASMESLGLSFCYMIYHAWQSVHSTWSAVRRCIHRLPSRAEHIVTNAAYSLLFLFGSWLFIYRPEYAANYGGVDTLIRLIFEKEHARMLHRLGSVLILYTVCWSAWLQRVFQSRLCRYLGRISFCVYVVHWPIMVLMGDYVKPWAQGQGWKEETGKRLAAAACYVASHAVAHVATVYVDEPYVKWLRALERRLEMNISPKPFPRHG